VKQNDDRNEQAKTLIFSGMPNMTKAHNLHLFNEVHFNNGNWLSVHDMAQFY